MNEYKAILKKHSLPDPPGGEVIDMRYVMGTADWYAKTADGWYWWSRDDRVWKYLPYGPTQH